MLIAILVAASLTFITEVLAQTQVPPPPGQRPPPLGTDSLRGEDKIVEGQVKSIDPSGTEITLTDGTRLVAPPGATVKPGLLEGTSVIASYREQNGEKVMTELMMKEPSASPPTEPRGPRTPSTAPPGGAPRY